MSRHGRPEQPEPPDPSPMQSAILAMLREFPDGLPRTKLIKLLYFLDYIYFQTVGRTYTGIQYRWDHYGPNAANFEIVDDAKALQQEGFVSLTEEDNDFVGASSKTYRYRLLQEAPGAELDPMAARIVEDVVRRYRRASVKTIAEASKKTPPFEQAKQGDVLDFDRPDAYYRTKVGGEPLTSKQLVGLMTDHGKPLEAIRRKYGVAAS